MWKDVDLDKKEIHLKQGCGRVRDFDEELNPTGTYTTKLKPLKTKNSKRTLNFDELIFKKLSALNEQQHNEDGLIFHSKTGLKHTCKSIYKIFQRILKNLELPNIGTHGLRRIFATNLLLNRGELPFPNTIFFDIPTFSGNNFKFAENSAKFQ